MPDNVIAGFKILEKLGEGGMGAVFKARQLSLDRLVALKILPPRLALNEADVERFKLEARAAANLKHSGIVQIYEAGEEGGVYFFAMEFVEGYSLGDWLRRSGRIDEADAVVVAEAVSTALAYAWSKAGIVHRDIKPDNLLIDADGTVKVADLGLIKMVGSDWLEEVSDDVMITPNYSSPEQIDGRDDVDFRTDVYSLGATLYHMLTGRMPFADVEWTEAMEKHRNAQLEDPAIVNPALSSGVCQLLQKMLAKEPGDRHGSWADVCEDIRRVKGGGQPAHRLTEGAASTVPFAASAPRAKAGAGRAAAAQTRAAAQRARGPAVAPAARQASRSVAASSPKRSLIPFTALSLIVLVLVVVGVKSHFHHKRLDEQRRIERKAARLYEVADEYRRNHPDDFDGAMREFRKVRQQTEGTKYASAADKAARAVARAKRQAIDKLLDKLKAEADALASDGRPAAAVTRIRNYSGPLAEETTSRRAALAAGYERLSRDRTSANRPVVDAAPGGSVWEEAAAEAETAREPRVDEKKKPVDEHSAAFAAVKSEHSAARAAAEREYAARRRAVEEDYAKLVDDRLNARQAEGQLGAVLHIRREKERFAAEKLVPERPPTDQPAMITDLQAQFSRRIQPVEDAYYAHVINLARTANARLRPLETALTMADRIERAVEVKTERERIAEDPVVVSALEILRKREAERAAAEEASGAARPAAPTMADPTEMASLPEATAPPVATLPPPPAVKAHPVTGMQFKLLFDQARGAQVTDHSGQNNQARKNGATYVRGGKQGMAVRFDGGTDEVVLPAAIDDAWTHGFTVSLWFKFVGLSSDVRPHCLVSNRDDAGNGFRLSYISATSRDLGRGRRPELKSANRLRFESRFFTAETSRDTVERERWNHVAIVYDPRGESARVHLNNRIVAETSKPSAYTVSGGEFRLGRDLGYGSAEVLVDAVLIYRRPVSTKLVPSLIRVLD